MNACAIPDADCGPAMAPLPAATCLRLMVLSETNTRHDVINAQDGDPDNLVSGGSGLDTCFFDPIDPTPRSCEIQNPS